MLFFLQHPAPSSGTSSRQAAHCIAAPSTIGEAYSPRRHGNRCTMYSALGKQRQCRPRTQVAFFFFFVPFYLFLKAEGGSTCGPEREAASAAAQHSQLLLLQLQLLHVLRRKHMHVSVITLNPSFLDGGLGIFRRRRMTPDFWLKRRKW